LYSLRQALRSPILAVSVLVLALGLTAVASGAPVLTIDAGPTGPTNDNMPEFEFHTDAEATFECSIDQGEANYGPCTEEGSHTTTESLEDGNYTFRVRATDLEEEPGETVAIRDFSVDTIAPTVSINSGPSGPVTDNTPSFGFTGEDGATFECSVDQGGASYSVCSSPYTPATLPDGSYIFRVRATDEAGNVSPVDTREFSVDTIDPETTITSQTLGTTDDTSPIFTFNANEGSVTFECRRDNEDFAPCSSPKAYSSLTEGPHEFAVRATDAAGNVDPTPEVENFTIDFTNPRLAIISGPEGPTQDSTPSFGFDAEGGTDVECSIDPVAQTVPSFGPCTNDSSYVVNVPLPDGSYTFAVRASDGPNETIETQDFTVDTVAPNTTIDSGPPSVTNNTGPTFGFSSNESGVSFECRRDSETFAPCTSTKVYAGLPDGIHNFRVRATDAAGNIDASVATSSFTIDTVAPVVSIDFGPTGTTSDNSPLFGFTVTGGSASACSIDQGSASFGPCSSGTSHGVTQILADGAYTFRVRGSDVAGNLATATQSFTVSTGAKPPAPQPLPPATPSSPRLLSPFPLVRLAGGLTGLGVKVNALTVRAPRGALVRVRIQPRCAKKARCAAKLGRATVGKKGAVRFKRLEHGYRAGTTIEIRVSQGTFVGKYTRFVVRRGKAPKRQDKCLMPGAKRGSKCPNG
jgi:hypothetical protein